MLAPDVPCVFVSVSRPPADAPIAVGQLVAQGNLTAVQCMATSLPWRREGAATAVLHQLACSAIEADARWLYLAVMANNPAALRLYTKTGFRVVHEYHYWADPHGAAPTVRAPSTSLGSWSRAASDRSSPS